MPAWIDNMKRRWGISSTWQFWAVMLVFSLAGMSVVRVKPYIFQFLHIPPDLPWWIDVPIWLFTVFPTYQVLLLFWAAVLFQWPFFWEKEKRLFRWMLRPIRKSAAA